MIKHKEIVLVRVLGNSRKRLMREVGEMLSEIRKLESGVSIEIYSSVSLPTDFSVHIDYFESKKRTSPSSLGQHLTEALKNFGLTSHSLWTIEEP